MGGSLRRTKQRRPKVLKSRKQARKSSKHEKSKLPEELRRQSADLKSKLGLDPDWDRLDHTAANMEKLGLVADANAAWGRNAKKDAVTAAVEADPSRLEAEVDDELKAACSQQRSTGPAPPKRLTSHQRAIVERLIQRHGDDLKAMSLDRELNSMQHSQGQLAKLVESFRYWKPGSGVDFRVPNKRLW